VFGFMVVRLSRLSCKGEKRSQKARLASNTSQCRAVEGIKASKLGGRSVVGLGKLMRVFLECHTTAFELA